MTADLLVLNANPADDISVLTDSDRVRMVIKEGLIVKAPYPELSAVNELLFKGESAV